MFPFSYRFVFVVLTGGNYLPEPSLGEDKQNVFRRNCRSEGLFHVGYCFCVLWRLFRRIVICRRVFVAC